MLSIPPFSKVDDKFKRIILQNELQKIRQTFRQVMQSKNDSKKLQICCSNAFQQFSETTACVLLKKKLLCKFLLFCHISLRSVTQLVCCRNRGVLQKKKLELFHFYMRAVCWCMRNTPTNDIKRPFFLTFLVTLHWTFYTQEESFYSALTPFSSFRFLMWDILTEYRSE